MFNYYLKERLKAKYGVFFYTLGAFYQGWQDTLFLERAYKHKGKKKNIQKFYAFYWSPNRSAKLLKLILVEGNMKNLHVF